MRVVGLPGLLGALLLVRCGPEAANVIVRAGFYTAEDFETPRVLPFLDGEIAVFTAPRPGRARPNEDAALHLALAPNRGVLAVADGAGGEPAGRRAASVALQEILSRFGGDDLASQREAVLSGFDRANRAVIDLGVGACTTLALVSLIDRSIRSFHAGDSLVLVVGQRGKRKLATIAHSPVGYAVQAGLIDEEEALVHEDLHVVSNMIGVAEMRVEMSARLRLAPRDTLLVASDGVGDNLSPDEIGELIRKGPLGKAALRLAAAVAERMRSTDPATPGKPDDVTFVLYRLNRGRMRSRSG
jgi:serine/threonine protein phosphatase PrpC